MKEEEEEEKKNRSPVVPAGVLRRHSRDRPFVEKITEREREGWKTRKVDSNTG